jgi:hypothetical protein
MELPRVQVLRITERIKAPSAKMPPNEFLFQICVNTIWACQGSSRSQRGENLQRRGHTLHKTAKLQVFLLSSVGHILSLESVEDTRTAFLVP